MEAQMSIFDYIEPEELEELEEIVMINRLGEATGLDFKKKEYGDGMYSYEARKGKARFHAHYSRYNMESHKRYISIGCDIGTEGRTGPCDSVDEAIKSLYIKILWATAREKKGEKA